MPDKTIVAGVSVDTRHWIGGERVASAETFTDVSPIDGRVLGEIARGGPAEAKAAVAAAREAFPGWAATPRAERARILHAIADGVEKRLEELRRVVDEGLASGVSKRTFEERIAEGDRILRTRRTGNGRI